MTTKKKTTSGIPSTGNIIIDALRESVTANLDYLYGDKATVNLESDVPDEWTMTVPVFMPREELEERLAGRADNKKLH